MNSPKVVAVGQGVTSIKVGDMVAPMPVSIAANANPAAKGRYNVCSSLYRPA